MHREIDTTEHPFQPRSNLGLYALTLIVGVLMVADLWPLLASWLQSTGLALPTWGTREFAGYRFALIAAVIGGIKVLVSAVDRLLEGKIGADLAIAIASLAAILIGEPLVAAEVIFIGLIGECLEAVTFDRTQRALRKLVELFPTRCWVLREGQEVRVLTNELQVGDLVVVKPGGKIPADGVVRDGRSAVDTAALTGESIATDRGPGDDVLAGSIVLNGQLTFQAKKVADSTVAGQVIQLTANALRDKGESERLADRLARYFLPAVLALAAVTFFFNLWFVRGPIGPDAQMLSLGAAARMALYPTLAVLVVACPCPLVLATPAAVIAALGRLAGTGVLVKGGSALERLAAVQGIAFDKTGTLTEGKPELGELVPFENTAPEELLRLAASAEQGSEHPLARAVIAAARDRQLALDPVESFEAHPGAGITAMMAGSTVTVGSARFLESLQLALPQSVTRTIEQLDQAGQTALLVARAGQLLGVLGVRDRLRPEAPGVIAELHAMGLKPIALLSGDRKAVAQSVAAELGIDEVHGELLPAQKAEWVARSPEKTLAFVGDGINDAPALARASVGIAIGTGTDVAAETGDVVLMGDPLRRLPMLIRLSRQTTHIIRQNIIGFGFGLNLVGVILTGWLWPLFAQSAAWFEKAPLAGVIFHQLGSIAVLFNSMRLLTFEREVKNSTLLRLGAGFQALDQFIGRFSFDDFLHELFHRWKAVTAALVALGLIVWGISGITMIAADQAGVVQRFGAVQAELAPGLHYRWPWPVETVTKLRPREVRIVEVGFRSLSPDRVAQLQQARAEQERLRRPGGTLNSSQTWSSGHGEDIQRLTDESLLITGDGNLVELLASVRYSVSDPQLFLFGSGDVESVIRSAAESVFREEAAGKPFLDLLTTERSRFEQRCAERLTQRLVSVAPAGLGITLDGLTIHDLHPPQEVVKAYHDVAEAIQRRDRTINDAEAEAIRSKRLAEQEAVRTVRQAEADAASKIADAKAARDAFLAWAAARATLTSAEEARLAAEIETAVRAGSDRPSAQRAAEQRRQELLANRRFLTEFRLGLDAFVTVLRGRDKILVDAENLPGKRHLLLMDPESSPRLPPVAFPPQGPDARER